MLATPEKIKALEALQTTMRKALTPQTPVKDALAYDNNPKEGEVEWDMGDYSLVLVKRTFQNGQWGPWIETEE